MELIHLYTHLVIWVFGYLLIRLKSDIITCMKSAIHPQYFDDAKVVCSCGNSFTVGSTKQTIHVDLCYNCHPFYTGQQRFVDTASRIERFKAKQTVAAQAAANKKVKKEEKIHEEEAPKTLRDMLSALKR